MRTDVRKIVRIICFCMTVILLFSFVSLTFRNKDDGNLCPIPVSYRNKCDVVFLGSSIVMDGIYPLQLYHDYGIAAYNLGCGDESMAESYYILKQVIRQTDVKLVVLDAFYVYRDHLYANDGRLHYVTDKLALPEKIACINDIVPFKDRLNYFCEISAYHDRWKELEGNDFQYWTERNRRIAYGARVHYRRGVMHEDVIDRDALQELPDSEEKYLRMIIEECMRNDIEIMIMLGPTQYTGEVLGEERSAFHGIWNQVGKIADEYGIPYLNFMYHFNELNLDPETDTDHGVHLNACGAPKLTSYLGGYIKDHYDIPDVRENPEYRFMDTDYEKFEKYRNDMIENAVGE